jgi:non-canonical purine NTP pyrophosphatase (RdgB/HAM1 family)
MELYFITGNQGKFREAKAILPELKQIDIDLSEIQSIDPKEIISNKLKEAFKHQDGEFVIEDTSLYLDCLNGLPGPLIKWFMKTIGNEGLYKITKKFGNYRAKAKTVIGYARDSGNIYFFEGEIEGKIVSPRGKYGFGWDPIFEVNKLGKTFAELTIDEKNKISMRKKAFEELKFFLKRNKKNASKEIY